MTEQLERYSYTPTLYDLNKLDKIVQEAKRKIKNSCDNDIAELHVAFHWCKRTFDEDIKE